MAEPTITKPKHYRDGKFSGYRVRVIFPFDEVLGYKPKEKAFRAKTERKASDAAKTWLASWHRGEKTHAIDRRDFGSFLINEFLPVEEARVKANGKSWEAYLNRKSRLRNYLLEPKDGLNAVRARELHRVRLSALTPQKIAQYFTALELDLVSAYLRDDLLGDLRLALRQAKSYLPTRFVDYFEDLKHVRPEKKKRPRYDYDDVWRVILDDSLPVEARAYVATMFIQRRRPSELAALQWSDVDWANCGIVWDKAVRRTADGIKPTDHAKNGIEGNRKNPMGEIVHDLLSRLRNERMANGNGSLYVWPSEDGGFMTRSAERSKWDAWREQLGLSANCWRYTIKHAGISFGAVSGQSSALQREITGHKDGTMIDRVYTEIPSRAKVEAISTFDRHARKVQKRRGAQRSASNGQ